MMQSTSVYSNY